MPTQDGNNLLIELARSIDPEKLRDQHREDGHGRCSSCRGGSSATGRVPWPCHSFVLAGKVEELQLRQRRAE